MAKLSEEARAVIDGAAPGLQVVAWFSWVAEQLNEDQRTLLSYAVTNLVNRGWLSPLPKLLPAAVDALGLSEDRVNAAWAVLLEHGLIEVDGDRVVTLAAVLATGKSDVNYFIGDDLSDKVALVGPLAALGIARALNRAGEVSAKCSGSTEKARVSLICDENGVHSRKPESVALFLPSWDGTTPPSAAVAGGGLFLDDDALAQWQTTHDDPDGMPLTSMFFPMAVNDLGERLGKALESMFDHVANFA
ncbi:MAG: hypothetical protein KC502_15370 [Myxococcales bacterium]|nr:hypothetical protein [Myxococcales bacterium]